MKKKMLVLIGLIGFLSSEAQISTRISGSWLTTLQRKDGKIVPFQMESQKKNGEIILDVINANERIEITNAQLAGDSLFFTMPAFESSFRLQMLPDGDMRGVYIKGTAGATQYWPVYAYANVKDRFATGKRNGEAKNNISGRWDVTITRANGTLRKAVAMLEQHGNKLTGSFLTPSSDYRYLDGIVSGDSLKLSGFDGDNIHLFEARITNENTISGGVFYNGYDGKEKWTATKNADIALPKVDEPTHLREGQTRLNFTFNDLHGTPVSINDEEYKNKVVIIQIMGSWCANCLDETRFLADYYNQNRSKGVEVIALAYELTADIKRSEKSVAKFQQLFNVRYPMLITGVTAGDDQKTEKTLPQLTPIKSFPTTIFIDKKGNVREIHTNFYGPASGEYYLESKKKFYEAVDKLLNEKL
ncbi:MAG: TlpA disulfide reductase family protein [Ginsengibacter sp.]